MNIAIPLEISPQTLARIKSLARAALRSHEDEKALYFAIKSLPAAQQAELLALYRLGWSRRTAYNPAVAAAKRQDPQFIAGQLAEKSNFLKYLKAGLKRHADQMERNHD